MLMMTLQGPAGLAGSAAVERLQTALIAFSQATGNTAAHPGKVDGLVGTKTVSAVSAVLPSVMGTFSQPAALALQAALIGAALSSTAMAAAKSQITQHASALAGAIALAQTRVAGANNTTGANVNVDPNAGITAGAGSIYTNWMGVWRIAKPFGMQGLGSPTHVEVGTSLTQPAGGTMVDVRTYQRATGTLPWYLTWWGMAAIGVGVVSVGATVIAVTR